MTNISPYIANEAERLNIRPKPSEYLMDNLRAFDAAPFPPLPKQTTWARVLRILLRREK